MKTTLDIQLILYKVISQTSAITNEITGGVYKEQRPVDSDKEDVVIGCETITGEQLQECTPTVKVHVPNKPIFINGKQDLNQPDTERINELTKLITEAVDESYFSDHWYYVIDQNTHAEGHEHFSQIQIKFNFLNTN